MGLLRIIAGIHTVVSGKASWGVSKTKEVSESMEVFDLGKL